MNRRHFLPFVLACLFLPATLTVQAQPSGTVVGWGRSDTAPPPPGLTGVVQLSAGELHSLALLSNGTVVAWGQFLYTGDPVPGDLTNVVQVSAGRHHNLALLSDGTVRAWGNDTSGETDVPAGLSNVIQVSAGFYHSLALRNDGTVVAWGDDFFNRTNVPSDLPVVVQISASNLHNAVLLADGTVRAWGSNGSAQIAVPAGLQEVVQISAAPLHTLALLDDGSVVAWGVNNWGQLNIPGGLTDVVQVSAAQFHSLALRADGTVVAWGRNQHGESTVPGGLTRVLQVAAGETHSLALVVPPPPPSTAMDGFGNNSHGQALPPPPPNVPNLSGLAPGQDHNVAIVNNCEVIAWGRNDRGQTNVPSDLGCAVQVAAGRDHSLALLEDGTVRGWGNNDHGQLNLPDIPTRARINVLRAGGNNTAIVTDEGEVFVFGEVGNEPVPPEVSEHPVADVDLGDHHVVVRRPNGTIVGWGRNSEGQTDFSDIPAGSVISQMAASNNNTVVRCNDGGVAVKGYLKTSPPPSNVRICGTSGRGELLDVVHVAVGEEHALAVLEDGTVVAWGDNAYGQLNVPEHLTNVVSVVAGGNHSLVLSDGYMLAVGAEEEDAGWRMLASPMDNATVQNLANRNLVRGLDDEYPGGSLNLYLGYSGNNDEEDPHRGFVPATELANSLTPGKGFIWYLFNEDFDPPETNGSSQGHALPFNLTFSGSTMLENYSVQFAADERSSESDDGFYLIGNPFNAPYDVSGISASSGGRSVFYYHWDAAEQDYILFNGSGITLPFEMPTEAPAGAGFFLQFSPTALPALPVTITFGPPTSPPTPGRSDEYVITRFELTGELLVEHNDNHIPMEIGDRNASVVFGQDGTDGADVLDAGKLSPLSYYWANIAMMGMQGDELVRRSMESRPLPLEPVTIPMALSTYASGLNAGGTFTITLAEDNLSAGWQVHLTDLETGETANMLTGSHTFTVDAQPAIDADQRFEITFTPPMVSGDGSGEAYVFGMDAIWPNPTMYTAQVDFTLEQTGEITIEVFDVLGRRVTQVANGEYVVGRHVLPINTNVFASGVYIVRLTAGSQTAVQRVTVAR